MGESEALMRMRDIWTNCTSNTEAVSYEPFGSAKDRMFTLTMR